MNLKTRFKAFGGLVARLFRQPVTVSGSFGVITAASRLLPRRDPERCTGCGACNERCSSGATSVTDTGTARKVSIDSLRCIFCARCADVCPEGALDLRFETIAQERSAAAGQYPAPGWLCMTDHDVPPAVSDRYCGDISLSHGIDEAGPMVDTVLTLQTCPVCGEVMPVTGRFLEIVTQRSLANLQPDTAAVMKPDMEKYMRACISCRRKMSMQWNTHPRKFI
jgi:ferredoxin